MFGYIPHCPFSRWTLSPSPRCWPLDRSGWCCHSSEPPVSWGGMLCRASGNPHLSEITKYKIIHNACNSKFSLKNTVLKLAFAMTIFCSLHTMNKFGISIDLPHLNSSPWTRKMLLPMRLGGYTHTAVTMLWKVFCNSQVDSHSSWQSHKKLEEFRYLQNNTEKFNLL